MKGCFSIFFLLLLLAVWFFLAGLFKSVSKIIRLFASGHSGRPPGAVARGAREGPTPRGRVALDEKILGQAMQVRFDRDPESGLIYSRVVVDLRGRSPGMVKIAPPGAASRIARMFGKQDIVIGDDAFDDHFIIMANPESLAH